MNSEECSKTSEYELGINYINTDHLKIVLEDSVRTFDLNALTQILFRKSCVIRVHLFIWRP
jgi:hypothetical protein